MFRHAPQIGQEDVSATGMNVMTRDTLWSLYSMRLPRATVLFFLQATGRSSHCFKRLANSGYLKNTKASVGTSQVCEHRNGTWGSMKASISSKPSIPIWSSNSEIISLNRSNMKLDGLPKSASARNFESTAYGCRGVLWEYLSLLSHLNTETHFITIELDS